MNSPNYQKTFKLPHPHSGGSCWVHGRHLAIAGKKGRIMFLSIDTGQVSILETKISANGYMLINPWDSKHCFAAGHSRSDKAHLVSYKTAEIKNLPDGIPPVLEGESEYFYGWRNFRKLNGVHFIDEYVSGTLRGNGLFYGVKKPTLGDSLFGCFDFLTGNQIATIPYYGVSRCF